MSDKEWGGSIYDMQVLVSFPDQIACNICMVFSPVPIPIGVGKEIGGL